MSIVKDILRKEVLEPALNKRLLNVTGYVIEYNPHTNAMSVAVLDPLTGTQSILMNVMYTLPMLGFHGVEPRIGNRVIVSFDNGDIGSPRAVAIIDDNYPRAGGPKDWIRTESGALTHNIYDSTSEE